MGDYLRKPALGTIERASRDAADHRRRIAYRNRRPCQCGSGRLSDPVNNNCIACDPQMKPALDAWRGKQGIKVS